MIIEINVLSQTKLNILQTPYNLLHQTSCHAIKHKKFQEHNMIDSFICKPIQIQNQQLLNVSQIPFHQFQSSQVLLYYSRFSMVMSLRLNRIDFPYLGSSLFW